MLSGIKKGKRKRKLEKSSSRKEKEQPRKTSTPGPSNDNQNAAEELRRMLSRGSSIQNTDPPAEVESNSSVDALQRFEQRRGKLDSAIGSQASEKLIIMHSNKAPTVQKEDFRSGARKGKIKNNEAYFHSDKDKTIDELVSEEKRAQQEGSKSMDEVFARNIARLGSRYKGTEFKSTAGESAGADEEDMAGNGGVEMKLFTSNESRLTDAAKYNREMSRQMARVNKEEKITSRCWWWMESSSFQKHRLLSLGDHLSLVLVPSHLALVPSQCYLVPVTHAESFASCEDEVWEEVSRFRTALRNMFAKENKGVLFSETVLSTKGLWQARMDVIPVPKSVEQDAEMFFKSAMTEEAEEWGTHNKILSTRGKGLRRTIPKGFSYFNIEWGDGGFAQIIETQSFPKDFSLDTIAGMMELDPMKFNRKKKAPDYDRDAVMKFLEGWKQFDWTNSLDADNA